MTGLINFNANLEARNKVRLLRLAVFIPSLSREYRSYSTFSS